MIADPIQWSSDGDYPAGRYFGCSSYAVFYLDIITSPMFEVNVLFQIGRQNLDRQDPKVYTFGRMVRLSKEEFYDKIKAKYPEHFEWLLFNTEWL